MGALNEIIIRAHCMVSDGERDAEKIIRECYDLEVYDDFMWSLIKAVFNPADILTSELEEQLVQYCIDELEDEVQDMIDDAEEEEERIEKRDELLEYWGIDYEANLGFRERDVVDNLDHVEEKVSGGHELAIFHHKDGEHTFEWDNDQQRVTG